MIKFENIPSGVAFLCQSLPLIPPPTLPRLLYGWLFPAAPVGVSGVGWFTDRCLAEISFLKAAQ